MTLDVVFLSKPVLVLILTIIFNVIIMVVESQAVEKSQCSCTLSNGTTVDISSLGKKSGGPRFGYEESIDGNPDWEYAANICFGFNDKECKNQVFCQRSTETPVKYFPIGNADSASWSPDCSEITYTETYESILRTSLLILECDLDGQQGNPTFIRNGETTQDYEFTLKSICACAGGCKPSSGANGGGLSVGSILCIMFSFFVISYLVLGAVYMKFARGAEGKEVIPNVNMWMNLPAYIKDGCLFLFHGCKASSEYQTMT